VFCTTPKPLAEMTNNYDIDISKNIKQESKSLRIAEMIYTYLFLVIAIFDFVYILIKREPIQNYVMGIVALIFFFIRYLQSNEKWVYKKFLSINSEGILWKRTLFIMGNLKWFSVRQINFAYTYIDFHLKTTKVKRFKLDNITPQQIDDLKKILSIICVQNKIIYVIK